MTDEELQAEKLGIPTEGPKVEKSEKKVSQVDEGTFSSLFG